MHHTQEQYKKHARRRFLANPQVERINACKRASLMGLGLCFSPSLHLSCLLVFFVICCGCNFFVVYACFMFGCFFVFGLFCAVCVFCCTCVFCVSFFPPFVFLLFAMCCYCVCLWLLFFACFFVFFKCFADCLYMLLWFLRIVCDV